MKIDTIDKAREAVLRYVDDTVRGPCAFDLALENFENLVRQEAIGDLDRMSGLDKLFSGLAKILGNEYNLQSNRQSNTN